MTSHASMKRTPFLAKSTMTIPERRRPKKNQWDLSAGWLLKYRGPYKEQLAARIRRGIKKNALNESTAGDHARERQLPVDQPYHGIRLYPPESPQQVDKHEKTTQRDNRRGQVLLRTVLTAETET